MVSGHVLMGIGAGDIFLCVELCFGSWGGRVRTVFSVVSCSLVPGEGRVRTVFSVVSCSLVLGEGRLGQSFL